MTPDHNARTWHDKSKTNMLEKLSCVRVYACLWWSGSGACWLQAAQPFQRSIAHAYNCNDYKGCALVQRCLLYDDAAGNNGCSQRWLDPNSETAAAAVAAAACLYDCLYLFAWYAWLAIRSIGWLVSSLLVCSHVCSLFACSCGRRLSTVWW